MNRPHATLPESLTFAPPVNLPTSEIFVSDTNPRLEECETDAEINALSDSLKSHGLMQPIGVRRVDLGKGKRYQLVWGARRLAASIVAGWETIPCVLTTADDAKAAELQAIENIQRRPMNPLEELLAVETLLKLQGDKPRDEAIAAVAARMGRSPTWVRERLYLGRLGKKARAAVLDGTLSLTLARHLAKVVDHRQQDVILSNCESDDGYEAAYLIDECNDSASSLHQVAWKLDAEGVAKGTPACTVCPHNSANDPHLFTKGDLERTRWEGYKQVKIEGPFCSKGSCYESKQKAATAAIGKAIEKAQKIAVKASPKGAKVKAAAADLAADLPPEIEWAAADAELQSHNNPSKKSASSSSGSGVVQDTAADKARREKAEAKRKEQEKAKAAKDELAKKLKATRIANLKKIPGAMTFLALLGAEYASDIEKVYGNLQKPQVPPKFCQLLAVVQSGGLTLKQLDALVAPAFENKYSSPLDQLEYAISDECEAQVLQILCGDPVPEPVAPAAKAAKGKKKGGRA